MNKKYALVVCGFFIVILSILLLKKDNNKSVSIALPSLEIALGQNFIVGIAGKTLDEATKEFLKNIKPAGIILYYRNYQNDSQFKDLIGQLQDFAKSTIGAPYFIMIDEEPGGATRLNLFKNVFDSGMPEWTKIENDIRKMAFVGINVDLAPLADFPFNEDTFIKKRVQAHNPEALKDFNEKFIALLQNNAISATLKHFPGMGVFIDDPHKTIPYVSNGQQAVEASIDIFRDGIAAGVDFVMTGHGVYDDIDINTPATISKKIATDILQNKLGFKGLVITDDLSDMPFIIGRDIDLTEATAQSLMAGHNLIIFSHRPDKMVKTFEQLLLHMQNDVALKSVIETNYLKIISFKQQHFLSFAQQVVD